MSLFMYKYFASDKKEEISICFCRMQYEILYVTQQLL
jgi:hypothetical protein